MKQHNNNDVYFPAVGVAVSTIFQWLMLNVYILFSQLHQENENCGPCCDPNLRPVIYGHRIQLKAEANLYLSLQLTAFCSRQQGAANSGSTSTVRQGGQKLSVILV